MFWLPLPCFGAPASRCGDCELTPDCFCAPGEWTLFTPRAAKLPRALAMCAALPLALPPKPPNADRAVEADWAEPVVCAGCFAPASVPTGSLESLLCGGAPLDRSSRPAPPCIQFTLFCWVGGASCEPCPPKVGDRISAPEELWTLSEALWCWLETVRPPPWLPRGTRLPDELWPLDLPRAPARLEDDWALCYPKGE